MEGATLALTQEKKEDIQVLLELGLTLLEAKIYYALTISGTTSAKVLSQTSGVSRPDVYRTLLKLSKLGLIEKVISNPNLFRAIPPETAFQILLDRKTTKLNKVKFKSEAFINKFRNSQLEHVSNIESKFVMVPSKETLINRLRIAIDNTKKSIDVVTTCKRLQQACNFLSESLEQAWDRNVRGRVIIESAEKNQIHVFKPIWKKPKAEFRTTNSVPTNIIAIYDEKEVFIFTESTSDIKQSPALWSNNDVLVSLAKHYFESMWTESK
ncbi:MAG: hypothetical protein CW691_00750 [Candidatus Bathyarchaeum sp.]|nr:MAG: hypothetical protein CW691_00750 [Candidatus Bathyarchaeum sp.]